jgi:hypothetical protein
MLTNSNTESRIEILKNRIDETIRQKDKKVKESDKSISRLEKELINLNTDFNCFESDLKKLKHEREIVEIACFKTIMKYHKEILKYQNGNNDNNR